MEKTLIYYTPNFNTSKQKMGFWGFGFWGFGFIVYMVVVLGVSKTKYICTIICFTI